MWNESTEDEPYVGVLIYVAYMMFLCFLDLLAWYTYSSTICYFNPVESFCLNPPFDCPSGTEQLEFIDLWYFLLILGRCKVVATKKITNLQNNYSASPC